MLVGLLLSLAGGCSDPPAPLTGQATWRDGCVASASGANCSEATHAVQGTNGSATHIVNCSVSSSGGGAYSITFRIANVTSGQSYSESTEGMFVSGTLPAVGQELARDEGLIDFRGLGYSIPQGNSTLGPLGSCHVFIDRVTGQSFQGRVACDNVQDDEVPPRSRYVRGIYPQTMRNEYGEFRFDNCDNF